MHKEPLTELEEKGLKAHGLDIGTASQLSDCFRLGMKWQANNKKAKKENDLYDFRYCEDSDAYYLIGKSKEKKPTTENPQKYHGEIIVKPYR